jgi:hypothetical protein
MRALPNRDALLAASDAKLSAADRDRLLGSSTRFEAGLGIVLGQARILMRRAN